MLKSLLNPDEDEKPRISTTANDKKNLNNLSQISKQQMKGKRKDLPDHTRNMLENERQKLVDLYRNLKKSKGVLADKS